MQEHYLDYPVFFALCPRIPTQRLNTLKSTFNHPSELRIVSNGLSKQLDRTCYPKSSWRTVRIQKH